VILGTVPPEADIPMDDEQLVVLGPLVRDHPWFRERARYTEALLRKRLNPDADRLLDAGCGWGVTMDYLEQKGWRVDGADISLGALQILDRPERRLFHVDLTDSAAATQVPDTYDCVLLLDVIEHVDHDHDLLRSVCRFLRPGGFLLVSVPSRPELFSRFDQVQGHRRRYTSQLLRSSAKLAGLEVSEIRHWGIIAYPLVFVNRRSGDKETYADYLRLGRASEKLARLIHRADSVVARHFQWRSTSLFAVMTPVDSRVETCTD
jgi:SAM-dependent methyltransferase